jgi:hypothetical protein
MPIDTDWSIDTVNRIIKYVGKGDVYTVNQLYSWLMDVFDNPEYMDDPIPMSARTPTDYQLINQWFIPYESFKYLKGGAIATADWDATKYDGGIVKITFESTGYVPCVASDIGKTVVGQTSGHTGVLLDYDNDHRFWWVRVSKAGQLFQDGETLVVQGGAGSGVIAFGGRKTGEWLWSNLYTLGAIRPDGVIYLFYGTYPFDERFFPDGDQIDKWWGTGHIDVLVMVKEAGSLIKSGYVTVFLREYMDTQDWFEIDLSVGGRNAVPLSTMIDISNRTKATAVMNYTDIKIAQVCGRLNVSGETGTFPKWAEVVGQTSGAKAIVLKHDPDLHYLILGQVEGTFQVGETISGAGVTATVASALDVSYRYMYEDIGDGAGPQPYELEINLNGRTLADFYEYIKYVTSRRFFDPDKVFFYKADTGEYMDLTSAASFSDPSDPTTMDDVLLPPQQATTAGDAIYFGGDAKFDCVQIYLTTPGSYSGITIAWEYWNGTAWTPLTVTDESNGFTNTMQKIWEVTFTPPADWAKTTVNGVEAYWIRARAVFGASPSITTAPKASQVWLRYGADWYIIQNDGTKLYRVVGYAFKYVQSTYSPVKACPFGQYLGGRFFGARGVWIENMSSADIKNYQLIDSNGVTRYPPNIISVKVVSCVPGDRVGVFRLTAVGGAINKQRYQVGFSTIDYAYFYKADTGEYVDETADINSPAANDVLLPPQQATTAGDAIYIGSDYKFSKVRLNVSTAGVYSGISIVWEYWNGTAWTSLTVADGTAGFTKSGVNEVSFTPPADWAKTTVAGVRAYWIRARAVFGASPSITTAPLAAQGWHWFNYKGSSVVGVTTAIASDEPFSSTVRITFPDGSEHVYEYASWKKDRFVLKEGVTLTQDYSEGQYLYVPIIDKTVPSGQTSVENLLVYSADIPVIVRVRQKGYLPFEVTTSIPSVGLTVSAIRTVDTIVT